MFKKQSDALQWGLLEVYAIKIKQKTGLGNTQQNRSQWCHSRNKLSIKVYIPEAETSGTLVPLSSWRATARAWPFRQESREYLSVESEKRKKNICYIWRKWRYIWWRIYYIWVFESLWRRVPTRSPYNVSRRPQALLTRSELATRFWVTTLKHERTIIHSRAQGKTWTKREHKTSKQKRSSLEERATLWGKANLKREFLKTKEEAIMNQKK